MTFLKKLSKRWNSGGVSKEALLVGIMAGAMILLGETLKEALTSSIGSSWAGIVAVFFLLLMFITFVLALDN